MTESAMVPRRRGKQGRAAARVLTMIATMATTLPAQQAKFETFSATTINLSTGAATELTMNVMRWSTDADRDRLTAALAAKGDAHLLDALPADTPAAGYVWGQEALGYTVRYAYRQPLPNGGTRVILLTDRPLGSWSGHPWTVKPAGSGRTDAGGGGATESPNYPFTVIELRLNASGAGEGKMSLTSRIAVDEAAHMIALEHYPTAPLLLKGVKHQRNQDS